MLVSSHSVKYLSEQFSFFIKLCNVFQRRMFSRIILFLLLCNISFFTASSIVVYNHTRFEPFDASGVLASFTLISSEVACLCQCFSNAMCVMAAYSTSGQMCSLYSVRFNEGRLQVVPTSIDAKVFVFGNISAVGEWKALLCHVLNTNTVLPG